MPLRTSQKKVILDEASSGMDVVARKELGDTIKRKKEGRAILVAPSFPFDFYFVLVGSKLFTEVSRMWLTSPPPMEVTLGGA